MSDKHLTETPWKTLAKQKKITKDAGLGKALADYGNAAEADHAARLTAIEDIKAGAKKLIKDHDDDKEVEDYLNEVLAQAEKTRKMVEAQAKGAAKDEDEKEEDEDDEEAAEYKKDLPTKLKSALNQVKSRAPGTGEAGGEAMPQLKFMAFVAGKACGVLVARKVGSSAKKLLPDIAGATGGGKFFKGDCIFEKNKHTFVLDQVPAGLARKLSNALLAETGMKYKVRVRSTDGAVDLDSDTDKDPDEIPVTTPTPGAPEDQLAKFNTRLKAMIPGIKANPLVKAFPGTPGEKGLNVVASEAAYLAKKQEFAKATELLDLIESSLKKGGGGGAAPSLDAMPAWQAARSTAIAKLKDIAKRIAAAKHAESTKALIELNAVIKQLTEEPNTLQKVTELERYLGDDDVVLDVCELAEDIRTPLLGALAQLKTQVAA